MQRSRQAINVAVVLMGLQDTTVAAHRPGTEGAAVSVRIGSALLYVADAETASRFTGAWRSVATAAERHLPRQGNPARATPMPGVAEPAVMVDAAGSPPAFARLERPAGQASHARVVLGRIMFDVRDLAAFRTTALAFDRVEELSASTFLPRPVEPTAKQRAARTAGRFFVAPAKDSRRQRREATRSGPAAAPAAAQASKAIESGR